MKLSLFRMICLFIALFSFAIKSKSQVAERVDSLAAIHDDVDLNWVNEETPDSSLVQQPSPFSYIYDRRLRSYKEAFSSLIPTNIIMQWYGDMGLVSVGVGVDYGKRKEWETSLLLGIIPKYNSTETKMTMTLKQTYLPWCLNLGNNVLLEPLTCGLYFNTVFSEHFWTKEPSRYPSGYYGFSTRIRSHIFLGQSITLEIPRNKRLFAKAISVFYEISTCDVYLVSAFTNSYLKPHDYLKLSFGMKLQLF